MIGENIKTLREKAGYTQAQLANEIGCSQGMVAQMERNTKTVSLNLAKEIARVLNVDIKDLIQ